MQRLSCHLKKKNKKVILKIWDNGTGIKEEELPRIFEKGFTGSNGRENERSTGIGLYLVKKLCQSWIWKYGQNLCSKNILLFIYRFRQNKTSDSKRQNSSQMDVGSLPFQMENSIFPDI